MALVRLAAVTIMLLTSSLGSNRSLHLDCQQALMGDSDLDPAGRPDLLVVENCSLVDLNYLLNFLGNKQRGFGGATFYTLWLVGLKSKPGAASPRCSPLLRSVDTVKVSNTDFASSSEPGLGALAGLVKCAAPRSLELSGNQLGRLTRLPADTVLSLNASRSGISEVAESGLWDLKAVEEVDLSGNRLVELGKGMFKMNRRLKRLHLQNNIISFITRHSFIGELIKKIERNI